MRLLVRWAAVGLAVGLGSMVVSGQAPAPASPPSPAVTPLPLDQQLPVDPAVRTGRLPNGVRFYLRENARPADRLAMRLAVDVGSLQEDEDQRGLAHFLEHMAFNGTEHFAPGELVRFLESIGAQFGPHVNASTSFDETIYMLNVPTGRPEVVERGMTALRDFAAGMQLLPEEIEKERGVVIEEWRGRLGASSRIADRQLPILLGGSRYAERLPIGTPEVLRTFPRQRLLDFYRRWYRPDRMAVVLVGDLELDAAEQLVTRHFGTIVPAESEVPEIGGEVPPHDETRVDVATDPEAQAWTVTVASKRPSEVERTIGDYREALVRQLVVQMFNLRLNELSRRPDAPFLGAQAGGGSLGRALEVFELTAVAPEGRTAAALEALVTEARRAETFGFAPPELERAKAALLATYERAFRERETAESPTLAAEYVRAFLEQEPIPGVAFEYQIASTFVPGITAAEATEAGRELFRARNRVVLAVAPEKAGTTPPAEASLRAALEKAAGTKLAAYDDSLAGRALVEDPPARGKVTGTRTVPEIGVTVWTLSNGAEVLVKPTDFKADQVLFSSYALGGSSLASEADFQEASLTSALVTTGGLGGLSPVDVTKLLAGKIAQVSPQITAYTHGTSGQASPRDLEAALQLNYLTFTAPTLTSDAFDLLKRRLTSLLQNQAQNPRAVFGERVERINTSDHYSARALTAADLATLDLDALRRFYTERFANAADFTFFIVGTVDLATLQPLVEQWIGGLPSTGSRRRTFNELPIRFPETNKSETVSKGREPASQTVMSFFADTGLEELEMHRLRAATSLLSQRLRDILREELGGTYGVSVSYQNASPQRGYGAVVVQFGSSPENVTKLTDAVLAEIRRLKESGPTAEQVASVQELERRDLETAVRQNQYWAGSLQTTHVLGWDPATIARRPERIEQLTVANLHEMFKRYFPLDRYTVVSLTPE